MIDPYQLVVVCAFSPVFIVASIVLLVEAGQERMAKRRCDKARRELYKQLSKEGVL